MGQEHAQIRASEIHINKGEKLLHVLDRGLPRLKGMVSELNHGFDGESPVPIGSFWKRLLFLPNNTPLLTPVDLPTIINIEQQGKADCVGATALSIISIISKIPITSELYDSFLALALKHKLATQKGQEIQVFPTILNILTTPEYETAFPLQKTAIVYKKDLTLSDISKVVQDLDDLNNKKKQSNKLFALCPVSSWKDKGGGHAVVLQKIGHNTVTVNDPNETNKKEIPRDEFNNHWKYNHNSAIFVFNRSVA